MGSSIARKSHVGAYTHAGPEIGVASTKAFTAQLAVLTMIALKIAFEKQTISEERYIQLLTELQAIPEKAKELLQYTTFNVSEVSLQVGFKSIFHFSKVFRQLSGRNPSEFKQFRYQPK